MTRPRFLSSIVLTGGLTLAACSGVPAADPRTAAPLVRTATVGSAGVESREFTGLVTARVASDLGFRVPGKIIERLVDAGQSVKAGQPLMRIDRTDYALAVTAS